MIMPIIVLLIYLLIMMVSINLDSRLFVSVYLFMFFFQNVLSPRVALVVASLILWIKYDVNLGLILGVLTLAYLIDYFLNKHFDLILVRMAVYLLIIILLFEMVGNSIFNLGTIGLGVALILVGWLLRKLLFTRNSDGIFINHDM